MADLPALPLETGVQPPVAVAHPALGRFLDPHSQLHSRIPARPVSVGSLPEAHCPARPAFRQREDLLVVADDFAATAREALSKAGGAASCRVGYRVGRSPVATAPPALEGALVKGECGFGFEHSRLLCRMNSQPLYASALHGSVLGT